MNYYEPREIMNPITKQGTGKWRYTCRRDDGIWAIGYCQDCGGHNTKEGAYVHYRLYILDKTEYSDFNPLPNESGRRPLLNSDGLPTQRPCRVCGKPVNGYYIETCFPHRTIYELCQEHCNREGLDKVLEVGNQISSW